MIHLVVSTITNRLLLLISDISSGSLGHCGADSEQIKVCVRHYRHNHNRAKSRLGRGCEVIMGKESNISWVEASD